MSPRRYSIYRIDVPDGRAYIGCTILPIETRYANHGHRHDSFNPDSIGAALRHYGKDACTITHLASAKTAEAAAVTEEALIAQHGTMWPDGCNLRPSSNMPGRVAERAQAA